MAAAPGRKARDGRRRPDADGSAARPASGVCQACLRCRAAAPQEDGTRTTVKVEGGREAERIRSVLEQRQDYKERQEGVLQQTLSWAASQLLT